MNLRNRSRIAKRASVRSFCVVRSARVRVGAGRCHGEAMARLFRIAFSRIAAAGAIALMSLFPGVAEAADLYLRGGVGFDWSGDTSFTDTDCTSTVPAALYGCGSRDGVPRSSRGDFGKTATLELGLGYAPGGAMRYELLVEHRPGYSFEGQANFLPPDRMQAVTADVSSLSGMLAAFADFSALGTRGRAVTPYVGAGVGAVRNRIGGTTMTFPATTTSVPAGSRVNSAWMVTAGFTLPLNERMGLDVAWRYTDLGEVRTGHGEGGVEWRDGSREPVPLDLGPTRARIRSHGLRVSLRYSF